MFYLTELANNLQMLTVKFEYYRTVFGGSNKASFIGS